MSLYFAFVRSLAPLARLVYRVHFAGIENIPKDGGYILCCNHRSILDPFFLAMPYPMQIRYMAKAELFEQHGRFAAWFWTKMGAFPVQRGRGDAASVRTAVEIVQKDKGVLGIFPEGHCMPKETPFQAKAGVTLIASKTNAAVLPACIYTDAEKVRPFQKVTVRFGKLIPFEDLKIQGDSLSSVRTAAGIITERVNELLEEKY